MRSRSSWDESVDGTWVCHWSFRGRPFPPSAPLVELSVRIERARRADGGAIGAVVEVTSNGVPDGCERHTPTRHTLWYPDPALPVLLDRLEAQAKSVDLRALAYCVLFGECGANITWAAGALLSRRRS